MVVTGWRVALEVTLSALTVLLIVAAWNWLETGVFNPLFGTAPPFEQMVYCGLFFGGVFAVFWLAAWQRIELHNATQTLDVASINTGYRWRTLHANDIARIGYSSHSKALGQMQLSGALGTRDLTMLEDSLFANAPSPRLKEVALFIRTHNPDVKIAAALK